MKHDDRRAYWQNGRHDVEWNYGRDCRAGRLAHNKRGREWWKLVKRKRGERVGERGEP